MSSYDIVREMSYKTPFSASPLLPLLLLSLSHQKHTPSITMDVTSMYDNYDYIVVGAGSAGSTVASRLSEKPCVNVLLLEAGRDPPLLTEVPVVTVAENSDLDWNFKTTPQKYAARLHKNRVMTVRAGKGMGGSSTINAELFILGNKEIYDDWAAQGARGWGYKEVHPYFVKLEDNRNAKFLKNGYHGSGGPMSVEDPRYHPPLQNAVYEAAKEFGYPIIDSNGPTQTGFTLFQGNTRDGQRCSTAKAYLVPAENRTNLHILPNAIVTKIIIRNRQAVGVLFEVNGSTYEVKTTREVIISAGTIKTAQLLMCSGIGPKSELQKHNIKVEMDLPVGENLQDHVFSPVGFTIDSKYPTISEKFKNLNNTQEYIDNRTGLLTSLKLLTAVAFLTKDIKPNCDFPKFTLYFPEFTSKTIKMMGLTDEAYDKAFKPYENKSTYFCNSQILQSKSRGYVRLNSSNPHDMPIINPKYLKRPEDVQVIIEGLEVCYKFGNSEPLKRLKSEPMNIPLPGCEKFVMFSSKYLECYVRSITSSIYHPVGTAKMGDSCDPTTVVDPELRVKGIKGLRVVDASVMPIITSGNTNFPTIMIAEKASDMIKDQIQC